MIKAERHKGCSVCCQPFTATDVIHVDHIVRLKHAPSRALDPTNLRLLHASCHSHHTHNNKAAVNDDGFPVDSDWS